MLRFFCPFATKKGPQGADEGHDSQGLEVLSGRIEVSGRLSKRLFIASTVRNAQCSQALCCRAKKALAVGDCRRVGNLRPATGDALPSIGQACLQGGALQVEGYAVGFASAPDLNLEVVRSRAC